MDIIDRLKKQIELQKSPNVYDGIEIEEWQAVRDLAESYLGETLEKIQNLIYNWYVRKLVGELRKATQCNKQVDASIYGGILEGIANVSIDRLRQEADRRLEDWERKNNADRPSVPGSTTE